jgi:predicted regulator of Ras-like GTPase activity (Roadblock/LC7/MglB family)
MTTTKKTIQDPDLARVEAALLRAAQKARKTAKDTLTPLVIYKDGRIIMQPVDEEMQQESR